MLATTSIALSGMNAAQRTLQASAHNIANLGTEGFRRQLVAPATAAAGGVETTVVHAPAAGASLEADLVGQLQARGQFLANLAVFRTAERMSGTLLDVLA